MLTDDYIESEDGYIVHTIHPDEDLSPSKVKNTSLLIEGRR
jgi:hypothetical protein